jgi:hypothetical protein
MGRYMGVHVYDLQETTDPIFRAVRPESQYIRLGRDMERDVASPSPQSVVDSRWRAGAAPLARIPPACARRIADAAPISKYDLHTCNSREGAISP